MFIASMPRLARFAVAAAGISALVGLTSSSTKSTAADRAWPARVAATYKVAFNGFDIGRFALEAEFRSGGYSIGGNAEISALLGAFKWQALSRASGTLKGYVAEPAAYTFDFQSNSKSGSVKMAFRHGDVAIVSAVPPAPAGEDLVPVEKRHLSDVLDPLSAVLALTRASTNPCEGKLPVFDGKQRFDLSLSPLGQRPVVDRVPSGQPGVVYVCEMRYRPIAGFKRGGDVEAMARSMKIEIALRPVPGANLMVPQEIKIPTAVGSAVLSLDRIEILTSNSDQIAFVN